MSPAEFKKLKRTLHNVVLDWVEEHDDVVKHPTIFADHMVDYAFDVLLEGLEADYVEGD